MIEEMLRRLHNADLRIFKEAKRPLQDTGPRNKIGVEEQNELRRPVGCQRQPQTVVHVAGLSVLTLDPKSVLAFKLCGELLDLWAGSVVEKPYPEVGMLDGLCPNNGALQDLPAFIICSDKYVYGRAGEKGQLVAFRLLRSVKRTRHEQRYQEGTQLTAKLHGEEGVDPEGGDECIGFRNG